MSRARRVWIGVLVFLVVAGVVGGAFRHTIKLAYHKRGLQTAKANSARLRERGPGPVDELKSLFRGTPWTSLEYAAEVRRHGEALVKLGFLKQAEYPIESGEFAAKDRMMQALEQMNGRCPWWYYSVPKGATSVVVIACARGLSEWEQKAEDLAAFEESCCSKERQLAASNLSPSEGF